MHVRCNASSGVLKHLQAPAPGVFKVDLNGNGTEGKLVYTPSSPYLTDLLLESLADSREYRMQHLATLPVEVGKFDHSFKYAKMVKLADGTKAYAAVGTFMNENQQVREL
jgi:hypothetical protein